MCKLGFAAVTNLMCELNSAEVSKVCVFVVVLWLVFLGLVFCFLLFWFEVLGFFVWVWLVLCFVSFLNLKKKKIGHWIELLASMLCYAIVDNMLIKLFWNQILLPLYRIFFFFVIYQSKKPLAKLEDLKYCGFWEEC